VVIYIGTLSKILAPGLRLGFMVAPGPVLDRVVEIRRVMDRQGDLALESAVAELLEEGEVQRHARKMRRTYEGRRAVLIDSLRRQLGSVLEFDIPIGGIALWARVQDGIDVDAWSRRALSLEATFAAGREFALDQKHKPCARFAFSAVNETEIEEGVRRIAQALQTTSKSRTLRR
jgi:GntR family transcriptional regulator/MocR family aminotransferase